MFLVPETVQYYPLVSSSFDNLTIINPRIESPTRPITVNIEPNMMISFDTSWLGGADWSSGLFAYGDKYELKAEGFIRTKIPVNRITANIIKIITRFILMELDCIWVL